jgi:transketolase
MSLGIALSMHLDGLDSQRVFCLLSDGDCQEGQTWEAATAAPHFADRGGASLTAIVDYNHLQTDGTTEEVMDTGDVRAKFESFGWDAIEIDGHEMTAVVEALERSRTLDRPAAIVCQTKKGKGVSAMEGRFGFHGKAAVNAEFAAEALEELEARLEQQTRALHAAAEDEE